ncbi:MAG: outer membrane receptor protein involved in Fe transport, partial [Rhodothermales bacterium]
GNPYLKPQYTHAFELGLQQFSQKGSLSLTPYFRRTVDEMERFKTVGTDGTSTTTWRNFDQSDSYGAELIGSVRFGRRFSGFASFNAYRVVTDASSLGEDLASSDLSWSTRANLSFNVREGLDLQGFWFYRAPREVAQGRIASFQVANLSVRQKLLNDKASLSLRISDPFNQMGFSFELDSPTFYQLGERNWESRRATLTFTYNFGQAPKQRRNQPRGDEGMGEMGIN